MGYDRRNFVVGLGAAGALIGLSLPALAAQGIQPRLVTMQALVVGPTLKSDLNSPELDASIPFRFRLEPGVKMIQWREARVLEPALPEVDLLTLEGAAELCRENLNGHDAPTIQFTGWVHPKLLSRVDKSKPVRVAVPIASAFLTFDMIEIH